MEMPWKIAISILMGVTNLVPSVGPVVGAVIAGVVFAFYDIKQALWFLGFTVILQTIDGLFIKPKLFGDSFGIPGIWMLLAMIVSGAIFGVPGLIVVVPVVAIAKYLIKHVFFNKEMLFPFTIVFVIFYVIYTVYEAIILTKLK